MKKLLTAGVALLSLVVFAGCQPKDSGTSASTEKTSEVAKQSKATVTLQEEGKELTNKTIEFKAGTKLYDAMTKNFKVEAKDGFITSINGHKQDEGAKKYWTFTINGKEIMKGAKDVTLKANDKIVFNLSMMK